MIDHDDEIVPSFPISTDLKTPPHVRTYVRRLSFVARGGRACDARERNGRRNERRSIKSTRSDASTTSTTSTMTSHDSKTNPPHYTHITSHTSHITPEDEQTIDRSFFCTLIVISHDPIPQYFIYIHILYRYMSISIYMCNIYYWSKHLVL